MADMKDLDVLENQHIYTDGFCTTELESMESNYIWTIKNFKTLYLEVDTLKTTICIPSKKDHVNVLNLRLKIGAKEQKFIKLELHQRKIAPGWSKIHLKANISIMNIYSGKKYATTTLEGFLKSGSSTLSKRDFISKDFLMENDKYLLPRDSLTIVCDFWQSGLKSTELGAESLVSLTITNRRKITGLEHDISQNEDIVFDNHDHVVQDYSKLFRNPVFSDGTIEVSGNTFKIHKAVLFTRCPAMLEQFNNINDPDEMLIVTDISPQIFKELLRFIYCGEVKNFEEIALRLIFAADKYSLNALKTMCKKALNHILNLENAMEILRAANQLEIECLKQKALLFIKHNFVDIIKENNLDTISFVRELLSFIILDE